MLSPRSFPNNLPLALSSFIGRGREIMEVRALLAHTRLATLTGPGGSGKTRLSLWVAEEVGPEYPHGVWLVELAAVADPALAPQTAAAALGLREQPGRPTLEVLAEHLAGRELLLVLDNCEHLIAACAALADALLRACPGLRLLATSREPLNIAGESVWPVPSLSLPVAGAGSSEAPVPALLQSEAVRLFVERASAAAPGFALTSQNAAAVAQVCRQVDGLPLAVELAAARVRALTVEQIAERLANHERFRLLSAGSRTAAPRQQTLAATLDWSYGLLDDSEKRLLRCLSVFAGGWTLEAAEAVCGSSGVLECLSRLVDKSLVVADQANGETRYRLLETIRQYAYDKLAEAGEATQARDRHLVYYADWAEAGEPRLYGAEQLTWLPRYAAEHANVRAALDLAASQSPARAADGLRLARGYGRFWRQHGHLSEGRARLSAAIASARASTPPYSQAAMARALYLAAGMAYLQSDYPATRALLEDSLAVARTLGAASQPSVAEALVLLGETATEEGDYAAASTLFDQSLGLWRKLGEKRGTADVLQQMGWAGMRTGDYSQVDARLQESLALFREIGDTLNIAFALAGLGEAAIRQSQFAKALPLLEESLAVRRGMGDKWGVGTSLGSLGWLAQCQGDLSRMRAAMAESLAVRLEIGDKGGIAWCLEKLAQAATLSPDPADKRRAAQVYAAAAALRAPVHSVIDPADQPEHERSLAALRAGLGEAGFESAWAEGARLPVEAAVEAALVEPAGEPAASSAAGKEQYGGLSRREREVAALIAQGKSNREIAEALVVGARTAETYISRILNKLGFSSRVQIATWAIDKGLVAKEDLQRP
jgi:predicted ATPase/DNA-binding CsgD family transcriptional regulator